MTSEYGFSALPPLSDITLDEVDIRREFERRPSRPPNYEAENRALIQLAEELTASPQNVLQKLTEIAVELCRTGSAGISLLENHGGRLWFRWAALAGAYEIHRGESMIWNASPCGVTVDRNMPQLMYMPERVFPMRAHPRIFEALLIPFHLDNVPVGTVWVVTHDTERKFDREDERLMSMLAKFASAAWMIYKAQIQKEELARKHWEELSVANEMLQTNRVIALNALRQANRNVAQAAKVLNLSQTYLDRLTSENQSGG